jgi:hypothetical protein
MVSQSPTAFAVKPGHVQLDVECVAEEHVGHWVTEKTTPDGARVAEKSTHSS